MCVGRRARLRGPAGGQRSDVCRAAPLPGLVGRDDRPPWAGRGLTPTSSPTSRLTASAPRALRAHPSCRLLAPVRVVSRQFGQRSGSEAPPGPPPSLTSHRESSKRHGGLRPPPAAASAYAFQEEAGWSKFDRPRASIVQIWPSQGQFWSDFVRFLPILDASEDDQAPLATARASEHPLAECLACSPPDRTLEPGGRDHQATNIHQ